MIGIVDYGLGNLTSVAGAVAKVGFEPKITADVEQLTYADKLILPGVGAFGDGMRNLRDRGLVGPLTDMVVKRGKPILGLCLGFQLMAGRSEEFGEHDGLGWVQADIVKLAPDDASLRVPHVGWNELYQVASSPLFQGIEDGALVYYVHSFRMEAKDRGIVIGECDYGGRIVAAIQSGNIFGTQFHPEKSQKSGLALLKNFLESR